MELLMLVGLPGSGKSSLSEAYREKGWRIHSSDQLRLELYGSEEVQGNSAEIFQTLENRAAKDLQAGFDCVLDATNLGRKRRMNLLRRFSAIGCRKHCMVVLAEPEVCRQRNQSRDRKVPEEAMDKMLRAFGMNEAQHRKALSALRAEIWIIENNLREQDYTFDYAKQPSKAMFRYRQAFMRNDRERYQAFMTNVKTGGAVLHTGTLMPYELVTSVHGV